MLLPAVLLAAACASGNASGPVKSTSTAPPSPSAASQPGFDTTTTPLSAASSSRPVGSNAARSTDAVCPALRVQIPATREEPLNPPLVAIEDPDHRVLAPFYEHLARLLRGKATDHIRIAFYGDSNMTLDLISGSMRRTLQKQYGDGGHGYVAVGKPWRWYHHLDVTHACIGEWAMFSPTTVRVRSWRYGLGGIVSATREVGARAVFGTAPSDAPVGQHASRFGVFYDVRSRGGPFDILVDGQKKATVDSSQGDGPIGYHVVHVEDARHEFSLVSQSRRLLRIFGVTLERDEPGIVLDCLGIGGISYFDLARLDPEVNAAMLQHRPYDLVMFLIGANTWKAHENPAAVAKLAALHRSHRKNQPILVMSPPDHTKRVSDATSDPQFVRIAEALRQAAKDNQCAYWDFRQAMGGEGSMARFFHANMAAKDLYHFTRSGAAFMGNRALHAIFQDFDDYVREHPTAGCNAAP